MFSFTNPKPLSVDTVLASLSTMVEDLAKVRGQQAEIVDEQENIIQTAALTKRSAEDEYARANAVAQKISALIS